MHHFCPCFGSGLGGVFSKEVFVIILRRKFIFSAEEKYWTMEDRKYPIFMDARFGLVYKEGANHMSGKISLEWADIIYDMSKARHL